MAPKILIVEDELKLQEIMTRFLRADGFQVEAAPDGESALAKYRCFKPDLIILDIMLPQMSGFDVCTIIRKESDVPIIFLTALFDDDSHMLGYRLGADDYITKPFKVSILAMKARRMLQRDRTAENNTVHFAGIVMNDIAHTVSIDDAEIILTQMEYDLLHEFLTNPGRVLTREYLLKHIWSYDYTGETRVVDTMVKNLRKKLGPKSKLIKTIISVGYKLDEID